MNIRTDRTRDRREGPSALRKIFHWLLRERRGLGNRRARVDTTVKEIR